MNHIVNPYIAGPPVSGGDFYGREEDVQKVLNSNHKLILFVATRRMGKTSLCYQIMHKCKTEAEYSSNLCLAWNLQGKRDVPSAKRRLFSFSNQQTLEKVNWKQLENISACHEVIEAVCEPYHASRNANTILLLLDEPDVFLYFSEDEKYDFLTGLRDTFEDVPNLRVVIVSPPRIMKLFEYREIPCLLENFQIYYLKEFSNSEAAHLIKLRKKTEVVPLKFLENGKQVLKDIIEVSNRIPFYIQQICCNIFDAYPGQRPLQVMENIIEQQTFSPYFTSDFNELHPIQKIMLLNLAHSHEPQESQVLIAEAKNTRPEIMEKIPTPKYIDEMVFLGVLKKFEGNKYHFSNRLFDQWILRDFDNLWSQTMREIKVQKSFETKRLVPGSLKHADLEKIKVELEALRDNLKTLDRQDRDAKVPPEFYFSKRLSLFREHGLLISKLKNHLTSLGASSLSEVLEQIAEGDDVISQKLNIAEQEGQAKGWSRIVSAVVADGSVSRVQAAMEAAFKVADYLGENN